MRVFAISLPLLLTTFCSGCATHKDSLERREQVFYYDRNGDGKVDQERHHYRGVADSNWELRDDDYDGRYENKVVFGVGIIESVVDIPVPTNVHIEAKR